MKLPLHHLKVVARTDRLKPVPFSMLHERSCLGALFSVSRSYWMAGGAVV